MLIVVGSYSTAEHPGIHIYKWEASGNSFFRINRISGVENPSYLTLTKGGGMIYTITENKEGSSSWLHVFDLRNNGQSVVLSSRVPFRAAGSCYISTDANARHAFVANYGEGSITVLRLPNGQEPGAVVQQLPFSGSGTDPVRQDQPHLHAALLSPDEHSLCCADLGTDRIYRFNYQPDRNPPLETAENPIVQLPPGCGPRQLAYSPDGRWLYVITELSAEIFVFDAIEPSGGWLQRLALTQEGYCGKMEGGDIQVDAEGRFLYASNRGSANEIVVFEIDGVSGTIDFRQRVGAAGLSPRSLLIGRQQDLLLVANEQSDNVSVFSINEDGTLNFITNDLQVPAPTCLKEIEY